MLQESNYDNNEVSCSFNVGTSTTISISGGRAEYQPGVANQVFFRGETVTVTTSGKVPTQTYNLEIATDAGVMRETQYNGGWRAVDSKTTSQTSFSFKISPDSMIGAYRISSSGVVSPTFYVIFNPGIDRQMPDGLWRKEDVSFSANPILPPWKCDVKTDQFQDKVFRWALYLTYGSDHESIALASLVGSGKIRTYIGSADFWTRIECPSDVLDIVSKWGSVGTIPPSPSEGDCKWVGSVVISFLRSIGIPSTAVTGHAISANPPWLISHLWVESFFYKDGEWSLIVSDPAATGYVTGEHAVPSDTRNDFSQAWMSDPLTKMEYWWDVHSEDEFTLSGSGTWGDYPNLTPQGYDHQLAATGVTLQESGSKLLLYVYDASDQNRFVKYDYRTQRVEITIQGAGYLDLGNYIVIMIPASLKAFKIVVDASNAEASTETYNLRVLLMKDGVLMNDARYQGTINQRQQAEFSATSDVDSNSVQINSGPSNGNWQQYVPVVVLVAALVSLSVLVISRRYRSKPRVLEVTDGPSIISKVLPT
jgi:hypothetical protein